jgi:ABC-2 type transport system ATP-binding protein
VAELLERFDLAGYAREKPEILSGGYRRRLMIARALVHRPRLLFLDEPTTGLDVTARETMWRTVRRLVKDGVSIVLTTHYIEEAEALADRVVVMARGRRVAEGTVAEIRAHVLRKRIDCATAVDPAAIAAWPGVTAAVRDGGRVTVNTTDAEGCVRRLLAADPDLADLEVRRAGLSEAFAELTQEPAAEAAE